MESIAEEIKELGLLIQHYCEEAGFEMPDDGSIEAIKVFALRIAKAGADAQRPTHRNINKDIDALIHTINP